MPTFTLSVPVIIILLVILIAIGGGLTYAALNVSGGLYQPTISLSFDAGYPGMSVDLRASIGGTPATDALLSPFFEAPSATDRCDTNPTLTDDAPALFPLGPTAVTFTATDDAGNA